MPKATFSKIDIGKGVGFWKTMPIFVRSFVGRGPAVENVLAIDHDFAVARWPGYIS